MDIYFNVYSEDTLESRSRREWEKFGFQQLLKLGAFLGIPIFENSEELAAKAFKYQEFERGQVLFTSSAINDLVLFIIDGGAKVSYTHGNDESIVNLCGPGSIVTSTENIFYNRPSNVDIEIIKRTRALVTTRMGLQNLLALSDHPFLKEIAFNKINLMALTFHKQLNTFIGLDNQKKLDRAMELFPTMFDHFPLKYIAKFLGMEPESLSRLRKADTRD